MKWSIKEVASVLLVVAVLAVGTLSGASEVWAQEKGGTLAERTTSLETGQVDGAQVEGVGEHVLLDPSGARFLTHSC